MIWPMDTPSRRTVVRAVTRGAAAAGVAVLAGCAVRRDSVPAVTVTGSRTPLPGESALLALLAEVAALASAATAARAGLGPAGGTVGDESTLLESLAAAHTLQWRTTRDRLARAGIPERVLDQGGRPVALATAPATTAPLATPTPAPTTPTSAATPATPATPATVARLESAVRAEPALVAMAGVPDDFRALTVSIATMRSAAAAQLGSPDAHPPTSATALALLPATYAMGYYLEVIAARARAPLATLARTQRAQVRTLTTTLIGAAAGKPPAAEVGYPLPLPIASPEDADALGRRIYTDAIATGGRTAYTLSKNPGDLGAAMAWTAALAAWARPWGAQLPPFPGMTLTP